MIKKTIFFAFVMLASATMLAQTTVTGLVKDAQTGETLLVDTTSKSVRNGYAAHYLKSVDYFEKSFNHSGAGTISSRIDESYVKKLLGYFKQKGAR